MNSLGKGKVILAACESNGYSHEDVNMKHGIFTYHLGNGLLGEAVNDLGDITLPNLYEYLSRKMQNSQKQTPVFKGDITGYIVLGNGIDIRKNVPLTDQTLEEIEQQAKNIVEDYFSNNTSVDFEIWKTHGYKNACASLEPILRWLKKKTEEHPSLSKRPIFSQAYNSSHQRLQQLGTLDIGTITSDGEIIDRLGSGTFGTVYLCKTNDSIHRQALKVFHPQDMGIKDKIARFERGFQAMKQLDHPHIVKVDKYSECPIGFYMDYIEGSNLRDFAGGVDEPDDIINILLYVAEILNHAHGRGVVHRDVKPENIIMHYNKKTSEWIPYLTDFDLAWYSTATQLTKEAIGTVFYAAPEQLAKPTSAQAHNKTTDIYSFGQLAYYTICKSDPVPMGLANNSYSLQNQLNRWGREEAARLFLELFEECTQTNPNRRPQDFLNICDRLFSIKELLKSVTIKDSTQFTNELIYSTIGLSKERRQNDSVFTSLSGQIQIEVFASNKKTEPLGILNLSLTFKPLGRLTLIGHDYAETHSIIYSRIEESLRSLGFPNCKLHSPSSQIYSVNILDVAIGYEGIKQCHKIIMRVINDMEKA